MRVPYHIFIEVEHVEERRYTKSSPNLTYNGATEENEEPELLEGSHV